MCSLSYIQGHSQRYYWKFSISFRFCLLNNSSSVHLMIRNWFKAIVLLVQQDFAFTTPLFHAIQIYATITIVRRDKLNLESFFFFIWAFNEISLNVLLLMTYVNRTMVIISCEFVWRKNWHRSQFFKENRFKWTYRSIVHTKILKF